MIYIRCPKCGNELVKVGELTAFIEALAGIEDASLLNLRRKVEAATLTIDSDNPHPDELVRRARDAVRQVKAEWKDEQGE